MKCPYSKKCNGCQLQNLDYDKQLQLKQVKCIRLLGKFAHVEEIMGMDNPLHYRNKVQSAFGVKNGKTVHGIYQSSNGNIVPVKDCMIEDLKANEIIETLDKLFISFKIKPFDSKSGKGLVRHILVKRGFVSGQIMVVIVTRNGEIKSKRSFVNALVKKHPEITTVVQNINCGDVNLSLGNENIILYGNGYIEEQLCGYNFRISPKAFYQVNPVQTVKLYNKALEFADLNGTETVIDAYCGTGTIGIILSAKAKKIVGVELNPDSVADAEFNAELNGVTNVEFHCADAGEYMTSLAQKGKTADVVVTDPPRIGCSREFLQSLVKLSPEKIVYVSCNPQTLARDLSYLKRKKYKIQKIQPVDMFPFTEHVETVVQLVRKKPDAYIDITVDMDELDLTTSEAKATYKKIKDYIFEKHNVKVSSLYIAQVKQKYGIIERENYNKPSDENARQPKCPPEKEVLIEEALRHFKMIS